MLPACSGGGVGFGGKMGSAGEPGTLQGIMGGRSEREQMGGLFIYSLKTEVFSDLTT